MILSRRSIINNVKNDKIEIQDEEDYSPFDKINIDDETKIFDSRINIINLIIN